MFDLYPHQVEMVDTFFSGIEKGKKRFLFQAPCAAGKTVTFADIVERCRKSFPKWKIAIITRIGILVTQAHDKVMAHMPESVFGSIGIASKKIARKVDLSKPITIATIQTLVNYSTSITFDLVIIDEVHQLNTKNRSSQYGRFLEEQEKKNPDLIIVGFTATPYRLGSGYIYGTPGVTCADNATPWFKTLDYSITMDDLQQQGFLVPYRAREIQDMRKELSGVETNGTGDYKINQLSSKMSEVRHVKSAVHAIQEHSKDRKHIAVFCVDIAHAERVKEAFNSAGIPAATVHSKKEESENVSTIKAFEQGRYRALVSVESLTTGFDSTCIDCILFLRPTKSPALFVQMFGRGLRLHEGKPDCLMLDMAGLFRQHGNPNAPEVVIPSVSKKQEAKKKETCEHCRHCEFLEHLNKWVCGNKHAKEYRWFVPKDHVCNLYAKKPKVRVCPVCKSVQQRPFQYNFCHVCGNPFPVKKTKPRSFKEDNNFYELTDVKFKNTAVSVIVRNKSLKRHISGRGNEGVMLRISALGNGGKRVWVNEYMDFSGLTGVRAKARGERLFHKFLGKIPGGNGSALDNRKAFLARIPKRISIIKTGRYWKLAI